MIAVRGAGSTVAKALQRLLPAGESYMRVQRDNALPKADKYLFAQGYLCGKSISDLSDADIQETFFVNAVRIMQECDELIDRQPNVRICILGSESGFSWSYDGAYSAAKAAVHRYVETKRLKWPDQQIVCVAPGIIGDAGMTTRRKDVARLDDRRERHPKKRFVTSAEVAKTIHHLLYVDLGYISSVVIRMNGGEHTV